MLRTIVILLSLMAARGRNVKVTVETR